MPTSAQAILDALDAMAANVADMASRLVQLEAGLELVRRHVVGLGQRTTALEQAPLSPLPTPRDSWAAPDVGDR